MGTQRKKSNPTIQDVARVAGVSTASVSRAISLPDQVSEPTRLRIANAIRTTGYVVNRSARSLRRRQTGTIVALVPNIGNPFFSNILEGIETVCAEKEINVLIADTQKPSMSQSKLQAYFSNNTADGIVILDGTISVEEMRSTNANLPPMVTAGEWSADPTVPVVLVDNLKGAELAVSHLYELGHRTFGHVSGHPNHLPGRERLEGFKRTLQARHIDPSEAWIFGGDYSLESGHQAGQSWLELSNPPSAVFCAGDGMTFAFISTLNRAGVCVPEDVSVVGFDDLDVAQHYIPALTTIHQPRRALGASAARHLIDLMEGRRVETRPARHEPWLVERDSTAAFMPGQPGKRRTGNSG